MQWFKDLFWAGVALWVYLFVGAITLDWMRLTKLISPKHIIDGLTVLDAGLVCAFVAVMCLSIRRERQVRILEKRVKKLEGRDVL